MLLGKLMRREARMDFLCMLRTQVPQLGALLPFLFWGRVPPAKIDYENKCTLILVFLEDLEC